MKTEIRYKISCLAYVWRRWTLWPIQALERLHAFFWNELLWRITTPALRVRLNQAFYSKENLYRVGSRFFNDGFFPWENDALAHLPPSGHVAVFSAGCGREVRALRQKGYTVTAFEPNPDFFREASDFFKDDPNVTWSPLSYEAFTSTGYSFSQPPDAVILGWGGASYLLEDSDRQDFFTKLRGLAPKAPLLLSYLMHPRPDHPWVKMRERASTVGTYRTYLPKAGFVYLYSEDSLQSLAKRTGYTIQNAYTEPYPYAIWTPHEF